jgi:hypothetical protein
VTQAAAPALVSVGFLTVLQENNGYLGGYLVTNVWGRPLEFRLSTAVQPNRVQQILYGGTLLPYVCADLIGKALVDKSATAAQLIVTDKEAVLDLRQKVETPVVWLGDDLNRVRQGAVVTHPRFPGDGPLVRDWLEHLDGLLDLAEPFGRIREAVGEARKMGVTHRG